MGRFDGLTLGEVAYMVVHAYSYSEHGPTCTLVEMTVAEIEKHGSTGVIGCSY